MSTFSPAHPVSQQQQGGKYTKRIAGTITGAVTHGGLIQITCVAHKFKTGNTVTVSGVGGTVEANGIWRVTKIDADHFDLQNSTFTNAYTSGGSAVRLAG